ncbi:MAG: C10 family peptidase [Lentisphaeria bacterium]|nr:C10 family peptidase [Lentisphaeria bacterium]
MSNFFTPVSDVAAAQSEDLIDLLIEGDSAQNDVSIIINTEESYTYTPGTILTSTLWNQSGTIYIQIKGKQTALTGYTYNKFCPNISATNSNKSVTGCSNTADSQILYYWLERGYKLSFTVTSNDYYILGHDQKTYYASENPTNGEGSMSEINNLLKTPDLKSGDFIAALNFYCGLKNHSTYASSTSTSWWLTDSTDGRSSNAVKAAGFDSYFFIYLKGSSETDKTITNNGTLNDVGYSVIREVLDYGEPLRVGIPGHAIYMDGYRKTDANGYEYHLNYGWGINASNSKWYTVNELTNLKLNYITIDLSPDVTVKVTSDKSEYYGGSFLRGMQRINNIQVDKATTFTFDDALAGKTITIKTKAEITSNVDVSFQNIKTNLRFSSSIGFQSKNAMSFEVIDAGIILNVSGADSVFKQNGSEAVDIDLDNSFVFAGNHANGFEYIEKNLNIENGYFYDKLDKNFVASVNGYAVRSGAGSDSISLDKNSAVMGDIDLGGGKNAISINNGSLIYGAFGGAENSLDVTMVIDDVTNIGPMLVLSDTAGETGFATATGSSINVTINQDIMAETFTLVQGVNSTKLRTFSVTLSVGSQKYTLNSSNPFASDAYTLAFADNKILLSVNDTIAPDAPVATADITKMTNKDVTVSATFPSDAIKKEYCINDGNWQEYPANGVVMSQNGKVSFRAVDAAGNNSPVTDYIVDNIDKVAPDKPSVTADITELTNKDVTLSVTFASDSFYKQYSLDGSSWTNCQNKVIIASNCTVYFRSLDEAGNISEVASYVVDNIDKTPPEKPVASADITAPTRANVTVSATFDAASVKNEYSVNGGEWQVYTKPILFTENGIIRFRSSDELGNASITNYAVTNIDRVAPEAPKVTANITAPTNKDVYVSAAFTEVNGTNEYSFDGKEWLTYTSAIKFTANGTVYFRSTDAAGNVGDIAAYTVNNIDRIAPDKPLYTVNTTGWTNKEVIVTAAFAADSALNEYKIGGGKWMAYSGNITVSENADVLLRSTDAAGNSSITSLTVKNIDKTAPELQLKKSTTAAVASEITITAQGTDDGSGVASIQYSFDNIKWFTGSSVTMYENGMVHFKVTDNVGNETLDSAIITNITDITPVDNIKGNNLSQILAWDQEQGKVGFVAINADTAPQWQGVWEWSEKELDMWRVAGTGRFSGSSVKKDGILLYNAANSTFAAWSNIDRADYGYVSLCHVAGNFNAKSVGALGGNDDFDDILIADEKGNFGVVLDGTSYKDIWHVEDNAKIVWELLGSGNFGAPTDSLVVKNNDNKFLYLWGNNDSTFKSWDWSIRTAGFLGSAWEYAASGDFSADQIDDIVVVNKYNNEVWIWENGNSSNSRWAGTMDTGFEVESVGDFNGDGYDDILLREHVTGWGGIGYWGAGYAGNWNDLNSRIETDMESKFAVIS